MRRLLPLCLALGCGGKMTPGGPSAATISANLRLAGQSESALMTDSLVAAGPSGLLSLQYYIYTIQICQSIDLTGSGFGNPRNCLELYRGPADAHFNAEMMGPPPADHTADSDYARKLTTGYIDLANPTSRALVANPVQLQPEDAHDYNYGLVNWAYPIKITAQLSPPGATSPVLYTHDGTTTLDASNGGHLYTTTSTTPFTQGPASQAIVQFDNGGSFFAFQAPFRISADDITNKVQFVLDLTFNGDGIVRGYPSFGGQARDVLVDTQGDGITAPMLDLTPVPHKQCERTIKEQYVGTFVFGADTFDLRLELYSLESDPQKKIYGVDVAALINAASPRPYGMAKAASIKSEADGSLDFLDTQPYPFLRGLVRRSHVGDTTSIQVDCDGMYSNPIPGTCSGTVPVELSLAGISAVNPTGACVCKTSSDCAGAGKVCVNGSCVACGQTGTSGVACSDKGLCCGSTCIDVSADGENCGGCGTTCTNGSTCAGGKCACGGTSLACVAGASSCSACGATAMCANGACKCNTVADCGNDPDVVCENGACVACAASAGGGACNRGLTCCKAGGHCVSLTTNANCGACGAVCTTSCTDHDSRTGKVACRPDCSATGLGDDCDHDVANGCETMVDTAQNCGLCGRVCSSGVCQQTSSGVWSPISYSCL